MNHLQEFLEYLEFQRSLSSNTVKSYRWDLLEYSRWLEERGLDVGQIRLRDVDAFIVFLRKKGDSVKTVNRKISSSKTFYRWLQRVEVIKDSPWENVQCLKQSRSLPKYLTLEQQEALIKASLNGGQKNAWIRKRNHLMTLLLIDTGLRVSELCNIEMEDLNLDEGILRIMGKGQKERQAVLSVRCLEALKEWISLIQGNVTFEGDLGPGLASRGINLASLAREHGLNYRTTAKALLRSSPDRSKKAKSFIEGKIHQRPIKYLFFNLRGGIWNQRHLFRVVQDLGKEAGIERLHPHVLRHTYATNLRRKGADLLLIKEALGHASVVTTEIYAHLGNEQYKEQIRALIN